MRLYLDDDIAAALLVRFLRHAGHDVETPVTAGIPGRADAVHLTCAIRENRVCLSRDYADYEELHLLIQQAQGHHPGILVVRQDNNPKRDLTPRGIVKALRNLEKAGVPVRDQYTVLNHWR